MDISYRQYRQEDVLLLCFEAKLEVPPVIVRFDERTGLTIGEMEAKAQKELIRYLSREVFSEILPKLKAMKPLLHEVQRGMNGYDPDAQSAFRQLANMIVGTIGIINDGTALLQPSKLMGIDPHDDEG